MTVVDIHPLALQLAADAIDAAARARESGPDNCRQCAGVEQPIVDAMRSIAGRLRREADALLATTAGKD